MKDSVTTNGEVITFKAKGDYSEFIYKKNVGGEAIQVVDIDSMTEEQFKKYCRDSGSEWFQRINVEVSL